MVKSCILCRQPALIDGHPIDGTIQAPSGWVAHMLCVLEWGRQRQERASAAVQDREGDSDVR